MSAKHICPRCGHREVLPALYDGHQWTCLCLHDRETVTLANGLRGTVGHYCGWISDDPCAIDEGQHASLQEAVA